MLSAFLVFLLGCLLLAGTLYVVSLVLPFTKLPDPLQRIVMVIVGLIGVTMLIMAAANVYNGHGLSLWQPLVR